MKFVSKRLPPSLRMLNDTAGLVFVDRDSVAGKLPIVGNTPPILPATQLANLPTNPNFHAQVLDLSIPEHLHDYKSIMDYNSGGYGMKINRLDRTMADKTIIDEDGTSRIIKTMYVYIEYFTPVRLAISQSNH